MTKFERIVWDAQQAIKGFPIFDQEAAEADAAITTARAAMLDAVGAGRDGEIRYHASTVLQKEDAARKAHGLADGARRYIAEVKERHGVELRQALSDAQAAIATAKEQIDEKHTVLEATRELAMSAALVDADAAQQHTKEVAWLLKELDDLRASLSANETLVSSIEEILQ